MNTITFLIVALITLGSGFMVVTTRNLIHAALWLVATLFFNVARGKKILSRVTV